MTGTGLMAFWADIDADYLQRYQEWHNCEHIPERVSIPGFREGRRYRLRGREGAFLMMYETEAPETLSSDAYLAALNAPTVWTREALTHFRDPVRNIYRLQDSSGAPGPFAAPWIASLRFNAAELPERWFSGLRAAPDVTRLRLYSVDEDISNIMTSERSVYGGGPGEQQYLLLVETATPEAAKAAFTDLPDSCTDAFTDEGWLEISHEWKGTTT